MAITWVPFGNRLRHYREKRALTQRLLADRMRCSRSYIARLESGRGINPTLGTILSLVGALQVSPAEFFEPFTDIIDLYMEANVDSRSFRR